MHGETMKRKKNYSLLWSKHSNCGNGECVQKLIRMWKNTRVYSVVCWREVCRKCYKVCKFPGFIGGTVETSVLLWYCAPPPDVCCPEFRVCIVASCRRVSAQPGMFCCALGTLVFEDWDTKGSWRFVGKPLGDRDQYSRRIDFLVEKK